jgi:hypothetical protein
MPNWRSTSATGTVVEPCKGGVGVVAVRPHRFQVHIHLALH